VVELLQSRSVNVNDTDASGNTALHLACTSGHLDIVKQLLHYGAAVNVSNKLGRTPLHEASSNGHKEVVAILCKHKADVNVIDKNGKTPLAEASFNGHKIIVHILTENKADANQKHNSPIENLEFIHIMLSIPKLPDIQPPLTSAVKMGYDEIVEHLLIKGAHVNVPNSEGWTELHTASYNGHLSIVQKLVKHGADVEAVTEMGATALCIASQEGHVDVAEFLLQSGADVNHTQSDGATPIMLASQLGHSQVVDVLMKHQATTTAVLNGNVTSAMCLAVLQRHPQTAELLLVHMIQLTKDDPAASQLLVLASFYGDMNIVKTLLAIGVSPDTVWNHTTPLMAAAYKCHKDIIQVLLANGADLYASKSWYENPLVVAINRDQLDCVDFILNQLMYSSRDILNMVFQPDDFTLIGWTVVQRKPSMVKILCEKGADVNAISNSLTPLLAAVTLNDSAMVKLLLQHGADPELETENRVTPLTQACFQGYKEIVQLLIDHGANVHNAVDKSKWSKGAEYLIMPFHMAELGRQIETAKILLENGADVNAITQSSHTWTIAINFNDTDMIKLLLQHHADTELPAKDTGLTALVTAIMMDNTHIVQLLLDHGANKNAVVKKPHTDFVYSALGAASVLNKTNVVKLLVKRGADTEIPITIGGKPFTPLFAACKNGFTEIAEILIEAGANVNSETSSGETPLHSALYNNDRKTADLLIKHGAHKDVGAFILENRHMIFMLALVILFSDLLLIYSGVRRMFSRYL
jgi:serine/threonine-protein phosphatase 6 regulatory ankyrin repeat subunit B